MPDYFAFDPDPRPPARPIPALACDAQFHVFGPEDKYPPRPEAAYKMPSATIERALHMHRTLGIQRGVIVQATTYGADHEVVLDGLAAAGPNYRGCANAVVLAERDDRYIAKLHDAGVRGARFTRAALGLKLGPQEFARAVARVVELGWYVKVQPEPEGILDNVPLIDKLTCPVLIDHLGRVDPTKGPDDATRRKMIELLGRGNFWVMLSLTEKISRAGAPWGDVVPVVHDYLAAAPDRCVWASDWPHPVSTRQPPNEGALLDFLDRAVPDAALKRKVLVDNPANLFGFNA